MSNELKLPEPLQWDWEDVKGLHKRVCRLEVEFSKANVTEEAWDTLQVLKARVESMSNRMAVFERLFEAIGRAARDYT